VIEEVFRTEWARVVAALVGFCRDVDVAEEAAQEAFALAVQHWARDGLPDEPRAWLVTVGRNKAIDRLRRDHRHAEKLPLLPPPAEPPMPATAIPDERLELIFLCCHPALAPEARVALTLRALGGLTTAEIARAFLVSEETMKRRLTRARTKIKVAGVPFAVPDEDLLPARLGTVLAVLYLIFNQGYGDQRVDLAAEAIHLGRMLVELLPDEPEPSALLALMLLHDAAATPAPGTASSSCWPTRIVRAGTPPRSRRDAPCCAPPAAPTRCRPRSPPCRPRTRSTGRAWPTCTPR
jgi:RNA polymerase sigma-70 factor (ECF subfamily)